jgi:predicted peptidase
VGASINDFLSYSLLDSSNNVLLPGRLHVPTEYDTDPNTLRPLVLFLHGSGESGTNNLTQINGNIDNLLAASKARGAFLYAPQTNIGWENSTLLSEAMTMIDRAIAERAVDPNRIYVTGLSMGGGGVWNFVNQFSNRVAAAVPICGVGPSPGFAPATVVNESIWAFHGRSDTNVPVTVTRNVINSLAAEAGLPIPTYPARSNTFFPSTQFDFPPTDIHYTDMRGSHDIWFQVYDIATNQPMYDWLFAHGAVPEPTIAIPVFLSLCAVFTRRRCFTSSTSSQRL